MTSTTQCPSCRSRAFSPVVADRFQCDSCGFDFLIRDDGTTTTFLAWDPAPSTPAKPRETARTAIPPSRRPKRS